MIWERNILRAAWQRGATTQKSSPQKLEMRTKRREDLFDISRQLIEAIDPVFLQDPSSPVIITLEGTPRGGKSIFRDAALIAIFGDVAACSFFGESENAAMWRKKVDGRMLEAVFLNARGSNPWPTDEFIEKRVYGGITMISNSYYDLPSLSGTLKKNGKIAIDVVNPNEPDGWERLVSVKTDDKRLLGSARWTKGLSALKKQENWRGVFGRRKKRGPEHYPLLPYRSSSTWRPGGQ